MTTPSLGERIKARRDAQRDQPAVRAIPAADLEARLAALEKRVTELEKKKR